MGFAPGCCVEETKHAHPVTLKRQGRVCTLILNGELYNAKELGRELKADTDRNEELFRASRSAAFHPKAVCGHFGNPALASR